MNINKFTQKSLEAVQNTEKLAYEYGNQQIDQEHLLLSLLTIDDSLILKLITKMGISGEQFVNEIVQNIGKLPKVSGGQVYFSNDANKVLVNAEDEAKAMGDEYVKTAEPGSEGFIPPLRNYKGEFFTGSLHSQRKSESGQRQPGSDLRYTE